MPSAHPASIGPARVRKARSPRATALTTQAAALSSQAAALSSQAAALAAQATALASQSIVKRPMPRERAVASQGRAAAGQGRAAAGSRSKRSDPKRLADLKAKLGDEDYMNGAILRIATVLSASLTLR